MKTNNSEIFAVQIMSTLQVGEARYVELEMVGDDARYALVETIDGDLLLTKMIDIQPLTQDQFITAVLQSAVQTGWMEEVSPGYFSLTEEGTRFVEEDLPKKDER